MTKMMAISIVAIFVLSMGIGFLVHGAMLAPEYARLNLYRSPEGSQAFLPFMILAHVLFAVGFVWIYNKGKEAKPFLQQGIRYGIAIAVLSTISTFLIYYAVMPLPGTLVVKQIVFDTLGVIVMGVVVAWLNK